VIIGESGFKLMKLNIQPITTQMNGTMTSQANPVLSLL